MKSASSPAQLRRFALTVATGLTLIAGLSWWRGHTTVPATLWTVAGVLVVAGLIAPQLLAPVERGWLALAAVLAWINTRIILTALFYLVVTPVAVVMRLFRDPLQRSFEPGASSYWTRRPAGVIDRKAYERQF
jgi:hypothetical protein